MSGREVYYLQAAEPLAPPMPDLRAVASAVYADSPHAGEMAMPTRPSEIAPGICARRYVAMSAALEDEMRALEDAGIVVRRVTGDAGTGRLKGARVLVTRAREQAVRICALLRLQGATPVLLPAIRFAAPSDPTQLQAAARRVGAFDYLVFTSANGVRSFLAALAAEGRDADALRGARVYAVGAATAADLLARGVTAEDIPARERAAGLAQLLLQRASPKEAGALIGPEPGDAELLQELREGGLTVEAVAAYRTISGADAAEASAVQAAGPPHAALFYSPSAVRGTLDALPRDFLRSARIVAVGPTTEDALRAAGLPPDAVAAAPSDQAVVEALCNLWHHS